MKSIRSLIVLFIACAVLTIVGCTPQQHEFAGILLENPEVVDDFTLTAVNDQDVSLSDFAGKYVFLYFGYGYCPDLCPDTLAKMARIREDLGEDADKVQVILVSVDPERDTPEVLAEYVSYFDESFVGITGTPEEIDAAGQPFGIYYEKHEGTAASGYLIDHTARTFLLDPERRVRISYAHDVLDDEILADLHWFFANDNFN